MKGVRKRNGIKRNYTVVHLSPFPRSSVLQPRYDSLSRTFGETREKIAMNFLVDIAGGTRIQDE